MVTSETLGILMHEMANLEFIQMVAEELGLESPEGEGGEEDEEDEEEIGDFRLNAGEDDSDTSSNATSESLNANVGGGNAATATKYPILGNPEDYTELGYFGMLRQGSGGDSNAAATSSTSRPLGAAAEGRNAVTLTESSRIWWLNEDAGEEDLKLLTPIAEEEEDAATASSEFAPLGASVEDGNALALAESPTIPCFNEYVGEDELGNLSLEPEENDAAAASSTPGSLGAAVDDGNAITLTESSRIWWLNEDLRKRDLGTLPQKSEENDAATAANNRSGS